MKIELCEHCNGNGFFDQFSHVDGHYTIECKACGGQGLVQSRVAPPVPTHVTNSAFQKFAIRACCDGEYGYFEEWGTTDEGGICAVSTKEFDKAMLFFDFSEAKVELDDLNNRNTQDGWEYYIVSFDLTFRVEATPVDCYRTKDDKPRPLSDEDRKSHYEAADRLVNTWLSGPKLHN